MCYWFGIGTEENDDLRLIKLVQAAMLGHVEATYDFASHLRRSGQLTEALYWAKRGSNLRPGVEEVYLDHLKKLVGQVEKQIAEQRS